MDNDIRISIIVPAYNVGRWLTRCIDSIIAQTYKNLEIILIDDGSTDDTFNIAELYARKDARIVAIHQENKGLIAVRETGIKLATGEYVGFVDGDDAIEPFMYERLLSNALKYHADISLCGILYCFNDGRRKPMHGTNCLSVYNREEGLIELLRGEKIEPSLCNKLYVRSLLYDSCINPNIINNEDLLRNFVLFQRAKKTVFEDFCGYLYWRREESMSNNFQTIQNWQHIICAREEIVKASSGEIKLEAEACLVSAYIGAYGCLDGIRDDEAYQLKKAYRNVLKQKKDIFKRLTKKQERIAGLIIDFPLGYTLFHTISQKYNAFKRKRFIGYRLEK